MLSISILSSCNKPSQSALANQNFLDQYGKQVKKINNQRNVSAGSDDNPSSSLNPGPGNVMTQNNSGLPDNMFEVSYNLANFPGTYGRPKISFDNINIPEQDAFGIRTDLGQKNYLLVSNQNLQNDIDFINQSSKQYDNEVSLQLIKEQRAAKQKKYLNLAKQSQKPQNDETKKDDVGVKKDTKKDDVGVKKDTKKDQDNKTTQPSQPLKKPTDNGTNNNHNPSPSAGGLNKQTVNSLTTNQTKNSPNNNQNSSPATDDPTRQIINK